MSKFKVRKSGLQVGGLLAIAMLVLLPPVGTAMLVAYFAGGYIINEIVNPKGK